MLGECKDELICDFAEVYGIYDIYAYKASHIATLALGLREDSRTKLKISGQKAPLETILQAVLLDQVNNLIYMLSDGKGEKPKRVSSIFLDDEETNEVFDTVEDFEKRWKEINEGGGTDE